MRLLYSLLKAISPIFIFCLAASAQEWTEIERALPVPHSSQGDHFGSAIDVDGSYFVVGAPQNDSKGLSSGIAYVYRKVDNEWERIAVLTASDGDAGDNFGKSVSIEGSLIAIGSPGTQTLGFNSGKVYLFQKPEEDWVDSEETSSLQPSDLKLGDKFGFNISIHNQEIAVVSELGDGILENSGAVYVFEPQTETGWYNSIETAKLIQGSATTNKFPGNFGVSVAFEDGLLVVGHPTYDDAESDQGCILVFERPELGWSNNSENALLTYSEPQPNGNLGFEITITPNSIVSTGRLIGDVGTYVNDLAFFDLQETWTNSVENSTFEIDENIYISKIETFQNGLVLSLPNVNDSRGEVRTYQKNENSWEVEKIIQVDDQLDFYRLGNTVSVSQSLLVLGTNDQSNLSFNSGAVGLIDLEDGNCSPNCFVTSFVSSSTQSAAQADFGCSVAISGNWAVAGSKHDGEMGYHSGAAYVYQKNGSSWDLKQKLIANDASINDEFGSSVSIYGNLIAVGSPRADLEDIHSNEGAVYLFKRINGDWVQIQKIVHPDRERGDYLGHDVAIYKNEILISGHSSGASSNIGKVALFEYSESSFSYLVDFLPPEPTSYSFWFGQQIDLFENKAIVGAGNARLVQRYNSSKALLFEKPEDGWQTQAAEIILYKSDETFGAYTNTPVVIQDSVAFYGDPRSVEPNPSTVLAGRIHGFKASLNGWETSTEDFEIIDPEENISQAFAHTLEISGHQFLTSNYLATQNEQEIGKVFLYKKNESWSDLEEPIELSTDEIIAESEFGRSVDIYGNTIVVGAPEETNETGVEAGGVYFFQSNEPYVTRVYSDQRAVGTDDDVIINIEFDRDVTVTGTPELLLEIEGEVVDATFVGSEGKLVQFSYTVQEGDDEAALSYYNENSFLYGGEIIDGDGLEANRVLPPVGGDNSLSYPNTTRLDGGIPPELVEATELPEETAENQQVLELTFSEQMQDITIENVLSTNIQIDSVAHTSEESFVIYFTIMDAGEATFDFTNDLFLDLVGHPWEGQAFSTTYVPRFDSKMTIGVGLRSGDVDWVDYDYDGKLDFFITGDDIDANPVTRLYRNTGDGFEEVFAGTFPNVMEGSFDWGDYDSDGDLDVVIMGFLQQPFRLLTELYTNSGDGFELNENVSFTPVSRGAVKWGDYDNDGHLDLLLIGQDVTSSSVTEIYQNQGDGTFIQILTDEVAGVSFGDATWVDYDTDGDLDFMISGVTGTAPENGPAITKLYQNTDDGFVEVFIDAFQGVQTGSIDFADYDIDGDPDLLLTGFTPDFTAFTGIYQNNGESFDLVDQDVLTPVIEGQGIWADADNDGDLDALITGNIITNNEKTTQLFLNLNGEFTAGPTFTEAGQSFASLGDHDADGDYDLIVSGQKNDFSLETTIYENQFTVVVNEGVRNTAPEAPVNLVTDYVDGTWTLSWLYGDDEESSLSALSYNVYLRSEIDTLIGAQSLSTGQRKVLKHLNSGFTKELQINKLLESGKYYWAAQTIDNGLSGSSFSSEQKVEIDEPIFELTDFDFDEIAALNSKWVDIDNDRDFDYLISGNKHVGNNFFKTALFVNNGEFGFTQTVIDSDVDIFRGDFDLADFDNDGDLDLIISGKRESLDHETLLYENDLNGTGVFVQLRSLNDFGGNVRWMDHEGDGDLDIIFYGVKKVFLQPDQFKWAIYENIDGEFLEKEIGFDTEGLVYKGLIDIDNDNDDDLLLWNGSEGYQQFRINNFGVFAEPINIFEGTQYFPSLVDFNNDGFQDILNHVPGGASQVLKIFTNQSGTGFEPYQGSDITTFIEGAWGDFNQDGWSDLVLNGTALGRGEANQRTKLFVNKATKLFELFGNNLEQLGGGEAKFVDFDNDGDLDLINSGLTLPEGAQGDHFNQILLYENNIENPNTQPLPPSNLTTTRDGDELVLSWSPGEDAETATATLTYNIYLAHESDTIIASHSFHNGLRKLVENGNMGYNLSYTFKGEIFVGGAYHWGVQTIDNGYMGSAFATAEPYYANFRPVIVEALRNFETLLEEPIEIALADFNVTDEDHTYPEGFTLEISTGDNYSVNGISVIPDEDFVGMLSVEVTISDGTDVSDPYSIEIEVLSDNIAPIITGLTAPLSTDEDTPLELEVSHFEITDPDDEYPDGFSLTISEGENYTVDGTTINPNHDYNGDLTVNATVNDGIDDSETFEFTITVNPINDKPQVEGQNSISVDEDSELTVSLSHFNVSDVDNEDNDLSISVGSGENYAVDGATITPAKDFSGELSVPITVNDGDLDGDVFMATVNVNPVNDPPSIISHTSMVINEDQSFSIPFTNLEITDVDNETGFSINPQPGDNYSVSGSNITLVKDFNGNLLVNVKASDGNAESENYTFPVTVNPVNDPPVIEGQVEMEVDEDTPFNITLSRLTVTDVDSESDQITLNINEGENYSLTDDDIQPVTNFNGDLMVNITVSDGLDPSEDFKFKVTVLPVNDPPVVQGQKDISIDEDNSLSISIDLLEIKDPDSDNEDFSIELKSGSDYTITDEGIKPDEDFNGLIEVGVIVIDGETRSDLYSLIVTVEPVNDAPEIIAGKDIQAEQDARITLIVQDYEIEDPDNGIEDMTLLLTEGSNYTIEGTTISPDSEFVGELSVPIRVSDGELTSEPYGQIIIVETVTAIVDNLSELLEIYPNPSKGILNIVFKSGVSEATVKLLTVDGRLLTSIIVSESVDISQTVQIDLSEYPSGAYLLQLQLDGKEFETRILKQ
ncbi:MAG: tandem-95 repeat protein [Cyclobacteriaceae bacterium]